MDERDIEMLVRKIVAETVVQAHRDVIAKIVKAELDRRGVTSQESK